MIKVFQLINFFHNLFLHNSCFAAYFIHFNLMIISQELTCEDAVCQQVYKRKDWFVIWFSSCCSTITSVKIKLCINLINTFNTSVGECISLCLNKDNEIIISWDCNSVKLVICFLSPFLTCTHKPHIKNILIDDIHDLYFLW